MLTEMNFPLPGAWLAPYSSETPAFYGAISPHPAGVYKTLALTDDKLPVREATLARICLFPNILRCLWI